MKKFKCQLVRSQYQTVEFEAEDLQTAEDIANQLFDDGGHWQEYVDVYDLEELK